MIANELKYYRYFVESFLKKLKVMQKDSELMLKMISKQIEKEIPNVNNTYDFIRREDLIDAIDGTEWYHIDNGEIVAGANSDMDSLYKLDDIIEAIGKLPTIGDI